MDILFRSNTVIYYYEYCYFTITNTFTLLYYSDRILLLLLRILLLLLRIFLLFKSNTVTSNTVTATTQIKYCYILLDFPNTVFTKTANDD